MNVSRICIDPGKRAVAVSMSEGQNIIKAGMVTGKFPENCVDPLIMGDLLFRSLVMTYGTADELHIERPMYEAHRKTSVNMQDVLDLSVVVGCFNTCASKVFSHTPMSWKGSVPKDVHHGRIAKHMLLGGTPREREIWTTFSEFKKDHNVRDAIALNLFAIGRVKRGGES